jgi:hypothetical protein
MAKRSADDTTFASQVVTGECYCSFPKLDKPDESKFGQNKYAIDAIFLDDTQATSIVKACKDHAMLNYKTTEGIDFPWKDGSSHNKSKYSGYKGRKFIVAKSKQQPVVVDVNNKALDPTKVYGGAIVRVNVTPMAYQIEDDVVIVEDGVKRIEKEVKRGITVILNGVQFLRDSERFGGGGTGFDNSYATTETEETENANMF